VIKEERKGGRMEIGKERKKGRMGGKGCIRKVVKEERWSRKKGRKGERTAVIKETGRKEEWGERNVSMYLYIHTSGQYKIAYSVKPFGGDNCAN
jgi:hypothetical protein